MDRFLVFGGSSGVGREAVLRLGQLGSVVAASRRGTVAGAGGLPVSPVVCDVRSYAEVCSAVARAGDGPWRAVVNCAGTGAFAPLDEDFALYWREIVETNLLGCLHVLSAAVRHPAGCRDIVTVGSLAACRPSRTPGNDVYAATKAAVHRSVEDFRLRLRKDGPRSRLTLIAPGFIQGTDFGPQYFRSSPERATPLFGDFPGLDAGDVADAIVHAIRAPTHMEYGMIVLRPTGQQD